MAGQAQSPNFTLILLGAAGALFILVALFYREDLLALLDTDPKAEWVSRQIEQSQANLMALGIALLIVSLLAAQIGFLEGLTRTSVVTNSVLALLTLSAPVALLEITLKPFARTEATTIFIQDEALGWRLKPNASGTWGGSPVTINAKGLRGPELPYEKPADAFRILYLGDSVTFGFRLPRHQQTYPYQLESILARRTGQSIETVNSGVGGYSPWQQYIFLSEEGIKYEPDLIIVAFVLNDVTEKFDLVQFGGTEEGYQLTHSIFNQFDIWASKSSLLYFVRDLSGRLRYGWNSQRGATVQESLEVEMLAFEADNPDIQTAWQITLDNLQQIVTFAQTREIPIVLVAFPFTFQFEDVAIRSTPQRILGQFAQDNDIPYLDLLPLLDDQLAAERLTPSAYFLDFDHLTVRGSRVVAEILADFIEDEDLIQVY